MFVHFNTYFEFCFFTYFSFTTPGEVGSSNDEEIEQLRQENKRLAEENNMLQLKNDILVDMVSLLPLDINLYILQGCHTLRELTEFLNYRKSQGNSGNFGFSFKLRAVLIFYENFREVLRFFEKS